MDERDTDRGPSDRPTVVVKKKKQWRKHGERQKAADGGNNPSSETVGITSRALSRQNRKKGQI